MAVDTATQHDASAPQTNILPKLLPHLDRHLVFPLIEFLEEGAEGDESQAELIKLKFELLRQTNMIDFVGSLDAQIHGLTEKPQKYDEQRQQVLQRRGELQEECHVIQDLLSNENVVNNLRSDKVANLNYLKENHGVTPEMVNTLYDFGHYQYSCGDYHGASDTLYQFRILVNNSSSI